MNEESLDLSFLYLSYCKKITDFFFVESDNISVTSSLSGQYYGNHVNKEQRPSITSGSYYGGQLSATESSRGDDIHDDTDNESLGGGKLSQCTYLEHIKLLKYINSRFPCSRNSPLI